MLLPFFMWLMLLPLLCFLMADVIAMFLLADVIAIVCVLFWLVADVVATVAVVFCHLWGCIILWQMLLPSCWLMLLPCFCCCIVADVVATMADGIAIYKTDVIGRCCLPGWQME